MKLYQALGVTRGDVVAFIGAGGKTSSIIALGRELASVGWRVLVTTTTRISRAELESFPFILSETASSAEVSEALARSGIVFLYGELGPEKVHGVSPKRIPKLLDAVDSDVLLVEADGARGALLKAPYEHEPVIPKGTSLVVAVVSLDVLGKPLQEPHVYNASRIDERYGYGLGNRVKTPWVAQLLRDRHILMQGVPKSARVFGLVNAVPPGGYLLGRARLIGRLALRVRGGRRGPTLPHYRRLNGVILGSVQQAEPVHEVIRPVGAVVLAAGLARRMGQMKVLLPWADDQTIIEHIVQQLLVSQLDPEAIVVVTGNEADRVEAALHGTGIQLVHNPLFAAGEMLSSLKVGLQAMPRYVAAALVVLGDQPRLQPRTVQMVMGAYATGQGEIIAPSYQMRRGHPILIDRRYWPELLELPAEAAPRDVINRHGDDIAYVVVDNDSVLKDVDTPAAYREERRRAGLE